MVTYQYRCPSCGPIEVSRPMGAARPTETCERCDAVAPREFAAPMLRRTSPTAARLRDVQDASASEPQVVTGVPPARRRAAPPDPRHAALPRPGRSASP